MKVKFRIQEKDYALDVIANSLQHLQVIISGAAFRIQGLVW